MTSIDKALEVCEVLSGVPRGMSLSDLARALRQPASTVHRLLARAQDGAATCGRTTRRSATA